MLVFTGAEDGSVDSKGVFAIAAAAASVVASEMTEPTPMAMDASLEVECTLWIYHWNAAMSFSFFFGSLFSFLIFFATAAGERRFNLFMTS